MQLHFRKFIMQMRPISADRCCQELQQFSAVSLFPAVALRFSLTARVWMYVIISVWRFRSVFTRTPSYRIRPSPFFLFYPPPFPTRVMQPHVFLSFFDVIKRNRKRADSVTWWHLILGSTWAISKVLNTVRFLFKNEFILQNTFTGLQCNLHCALSQRSNV